MLQDNAKTAKPAGLLKKPGACQKLTLSLRTLNYKMAKGELPYLKFGGAVRFLERDLDKYIAAHRIGGKPIRRKGRTATTT